MLASPTLANQLVMLFMFTMKGVVWVFYRK